ncbi:MAG: ROK family protein [Actinobacteria bacterium]|nr:ROK family protein [Actinomycetota bacterium]
MDDKHAIGVDVGGTKILAGVVSADGHVLRRHERSTPTDTQEHVVAELETAIAELLDDSVAAIGFGAPSSTDQRRGYLYPTVNTPLGNIPLRDRIQERFGLPVGLDNDANAAAIGEWKAGAGRGVDDMLMLTLGTGVGGGVISEGRPFRGNNGIGAELGHVVVVHNGKPCQGICTGRGHLEAYLTGLAATAAAREAFGPSADAHRLVRLANEGEETAIEILTGIGRILGSGLGSFANVFGPELIVIGGGFGVAAFEFLIPPALEVMHREALEPMRSMARVEKAQLGTAAGLIGAAFVAFEALEAVAA